MAPAIFRFLRGKIDSRVKDKTLLQLSARLTILGLPAAESIIVAISPQGKLAKEKIYEILSEGIGRDNPFIYLIALANIPMFMRNIGLHFRRVLSSVLYIGPARARSERYYRYQDLAVNEIDPDGKNFPMFLNSLSRVRQESFSNWVQKLYGYSVSVAQRTGHISINLSDRDVSANIVDVGYGISQVLPVLGQIWWAQERVQSGPIGAKIAFLAIEQPELHLHPAHQAILADALVGALAESASRQRGVQLHFIIETHSETLINRLGELISERKLNPPDIHVVLFEPSDDGKSTSVRTSRFDDEGSLISWPYGFFQPNAI